MLDDIKKKIEDGIYIPISSIWGAYCDLTEEVERREINRRLEKEKREAEELLKKDKLNKDVTQDKLGDPGVCSFCGKEVPNLRYHQIKCNGVDKGISLKNSLKYRDDFNDLKSNSKVLEELEKANLESNIMPGSSDSSRSIRG